MVAKGSLRIQDIGTLTFDVDEVVDVFLQRRCLLLHSTRHGTVRIPHDERIGREDETDGKTKQTTESGSVKSASRSYPSYVRQLTSLILSH